MKDDTFVSTNIRAALNGEKTTKRIKALVDDELLRLRIREELKSLDQDVQWKMKIDDVLKRGCMENQCDDDILEQD